jgi:tetratricopeptide (TPR) repeat protein
MPPAAAALWRAASSAERRTMVDGAWPDENVRARLIRFAAQHFHMREVSLRQRERGVERAAKLPALPSSLARDLVRARLLASERPLLSAFLDALGLGHANGIIERLPADPPREALLASAVAQVRSRFPPELVRSYLTALYETGEPYWSGLAFLLAAWESPPDREAPTEEAALPPAPVEQQVGQHLTGLDNLLTRTIVAGVTDTEGAPPPDQLEDLVEEFVHLNSSRHQGYFHLGYLHALLRRPLEPNFAGSNPERKAWYLADAIVGMARYADWRGIVTLLEGGELELLGATDACSAIANQHVVRALIELDRPTAIITFLTAGAVFPTGCFPQLLGCAESLFRRQSLGEASSILLLLRRAFALEPGLLGEPAHHRVECLLSHCRQWLGDLPEAIEILESLLALPALPDRAATLADLAMAKAGVFGLFQVKIADSEPARRELRQQLESVRPVLESATAEAGQTGHAHFCLGVLALLDCRYSEASVHLEHAHAAIHRSNPLYRAFSLPERCEAYLAAALFGTVDRLDRALALFRASLDSGFRPPDCHLTLAAEALASARREPDLDGLARLVETKFGPDALDAFIEADQPTCAVLLRRLLQRGLDPDRKTALRIADLLAVAGQAGASSARELQEEALDNLEALARSFPQASATLKVIQFLENDAGQPYDPAWSRREAIAAAAALRDARGETAMAGQLLLRLGFTVLHENRFGAADEAADLAVEAKAYGADTTMLEARLVPELLPPPPLRPDGRPVRVCICGGDERMRHAAPEIERRVRALDAHITLTFRITDWNSNIGPQFQAMQGELQRSDAIVVLRRIRTNLGRMLRAHHPCWIGCARDGPEPVARAVLLAAERARGVGTAAGAASA